MKNLLHALVGCLLCLRTLASSGHSDCLFTHYSSEEGLSQNTVMSILQDRKGNMWFATWDGLNKFDGYSFKTYKARPYNQIALSNNRVDCLHEDVYGFIWLLTYNRLAFRFDPRTDTFERVPSAAEAGAGFSVRAIRPLLDGAVWLLADKGDAVRVSTDAMTGRLSCEWYRESMECFPASRMNDVCLDSDGREWLLTDNGLGMRPAGGGTPVFHFSGKARNDDAKDQPFYAYCETEEELLFGSDNGRVWRYRKADGQFRLMQLPSPSQIVSVVSLGGNDLLLATAADGFFVCNPAAGTRTHYDASQLPDAPVLSARRDKTGEIWFEQEVPGTVAHFNPLTDHLKTEAVPVEPVSSDRSGPAFHIHEDVHGTVWVHPYGGGFSRFDKQANTLRPFYNSLSDSSRHFSNKIHSAYSDRQGNLWMCTHSKGLEKVTFRPSQFGLLAPSGRGYESPGNEVRAICEDHDRNLWVGVKDGKLRVYDEKRTYRGYLTEAGTVSTAGRPMKGNVYFLLPDSKGNLWIATKGDGLVKAEPQGGRYRLTHYRYSKDDIYSLSDDNVYCVYEDKRGRIWVATYGGGINYLTRDEIGREVFMNHRNHLKGYPIDNCYKVRFVTGDEQGNIWIGTTLGALVAKDSFRSADEAVFRHFRHIPEDGHSLSNNDVHWIIPTRQNGLYLATFGGGLNKLLSLDDGQGQAQFKSYSVENGLPSDVLLSIREDRTGNLWISTENGICKFVPSEERFENYSDKSISFRVRFSEAASAYTSQGKMLFGASEGIFFFYPDSIRKSGFVPPVVFSGLLIANKNVAPSPSSPVLNQSLDNVNELALSHRENIFTLQYAALDYSAPSEIQYAYILEGFEKAWNYVGTQRTATYTNLPKGHYTFKIRSTNADGVWTDNVRTLGITIEPSFWETPPAYFLYVLLLLAVVMTAVYILFTIYRLKHKVSVEQQLTDMKLRFFTDISHELRTPLTLIAGPVEYILQNTPMPDDAREQLKVVERNADRMLRLVNQILDFRKIQNRKMKMQVQRIEVVGFVRKVMENFESVAEEHRIDFLLEAEKDNLYLWADADKLEKIVYNLLSNAFKYTPEGKMISIFVREDEKTVSVGVQDRGIGIDESSRKSLFMRFENLANQKLFARADSTGIGLSLVKELAEMHKATITVDSRPGEGSCFRVDFRKGKEHFDAATEFLQDDATADMEAEASPAEGKASTEAGDGRPSARETMLLVEDNRELRLFLRSIFAADYRVAEAEDGTQGLDKALQLLPDIIISDIMMPGKDGIDLTKELRAAMTTSHIPVILLTAKASTESRLRGLEYGADDYITKPFSATYLKARVRNLLDCRQKMQEAFRREFASHTAGDTGEEPYKANMSPNDRKFMNRLAELMEANMDNGDLVVDDLVRGLAVSRSVFFKKLKSLTGLAPVEFIREMRIDRAVRLIEQGGYSIAQVSYMVGINDPRYFSKCFKAKMQMTPTEYRDKVHGRK